MAKIETCGCQGCRSLADRYKGDPGLLAFYRRQLLIRGWAGVTDDMEAAYMLAHAPWYRAAVERGRETAARTGFGKRVAETGGASATKDGKLGGQGHQPQPLHQDRLPLALK